MILTEKLDEFHFGVNDLREWGKSTGMWLFKIYSSWAKTGKPWIYLTRTCVEITESLIDTIFETNINKWLDKPIEPKYSANELKNGIVDVTVEGKTFIRIVSLSVKLRRIKLATLRNCGGIFMDEYIIDPRSGEKYVQGEAFKIKEAYTTWRRESDGILRFYAAGNPYSLFNPLFMDWEVKSEDLLKSKGDFLVGDSWLIRWANLPEGLVAKIREVNPLYEFDADYSSYALDGNAINDANIRILGRQPQGYSLRFVLRAQGRNVGVYRNDVYKDGSFQYWVAFVDEISAKRTAWAFDLSELIDRTAMVGIEERMKLQGFKTAIRLRAVEYADVSAYYLIEEIFKSI